MFLKGKAQLKERTILILFGTNSFIGKIIHQYTGVIIGWYSLFLYNIYSNGVNKYEEEEKEVQKMVGDVMMWKTVIENVFPIVLVILIGSWSDKYGRKVPMLFVVLGFMVQNLGLMLCVYLGSTVGAYTVALVCSVIPGLTGNQACFSMAAFNYVTDTTPKEKLSVRTGISHSSLFFGITVGLGLGGFLSTTTLGFTKIFAIGFLLELAIFLYILVVIKNVVRDPDAIKGKSLGEMAGDLLSLHHLKDAFSAVLKKRPGNTRMKLILLLVSHFCIMAPMMGK
jgi:PCFT/HCP family folate transporter-like MFS transporter 1/3